MAESSSAPSLHKVAVVGAGMLGIRIAGQCTGIVEGKWLMSQQTTVYYARLLSVALWHTRQVVPLCNGSSSFSRRAGSSGLHSACVWPEPSHSADRPLHHCQTASGAPAAGDTGGGPATEGEQAATQMIGPPVDQMVTDTHLPDIVVIPGYSKFLLNRSSPSHHQTSVAIHRNKTFGELYSMVTFGSWELRSYTHFQFSYKLQLNRNKSTRFVLN